MNAFGTRLRTALLTGRRSHRYGVGRASNRRSDGYEFAELRAYVEGDDPRRIDWAATARASEMQMRVAYEDASLEFAAAIDASASMLVGRRRTNYDVGCEAAGAWYAAAAGNDRCSRLGAALLRSRMARGRTAGALCAEAREEPGTTLGAELELGLAVLARDTRLLVVSDFFAFAELAPVLRACALRFDVTALVSRDPWRGALPLTGFVRFRDATTGDVARVYVTGAARARYADAVRRREASVLEALAEFGIRTASLDPDAAAELALGNAFGF